MPTTGKFDDLLKNQILENLINLGGKRQRALSVNPTPSGRGKESEVSLSNKDIERGHNHLQRSHESAGQGRKSAAAPTARTPPCDLSQGKDKIMPKVDDAGTKLSTLKF